MIVLSACFVGLRCRYNGEASENEFALDMLRQEMGIPLCPEQLGGLPTPRLPCEIKGGDGGDVLDGRAKVVDAKGNDWSAEFIRGAHEVLSFCLRNQITKAVLKSRSPSCGCGEIYDGNFSGMLRSGDGVTTALLRRNGVLVECF